MLNDEKAECIQGFVSQLFQELQRGSTLRVQQVMQRTHLQSHAQQHQAIATTSPQAMPLFAPLLHGAHPIAISGRSGRSTAGSITSQTVGGAPQLSTGTQSPPVESTGGKQAAMLWIGATDAQLEVARAALERALFSRVYMSAMFPNREIDEMRDKCAIILFLLFRYYICT